MTTFPVPATRPRISLQILVLLSSSAFASIFATLPLRTMLEHFIYEDMFYYLRVAQHINAGNGSSFDGVSPTNGYHPAWMLLSTAAARAFEGEQLVRFMLFVAAILHGLQATLVYRIVYRHSGTAIALLVTALFAFNWRVVATNLCGLETPLALAMLLVIVDFLDRTPGERLAEPRAAVALGLLSGTAVLSRFDMLLFSGVAVLFLTALCLRHSFRRAMLQGVIAAATLALVLVPWFIFSLKVSGVLLPNSREATSILWGAGADLSSVSAFVSWFKDRLFSGVHWVTDSANMLGLWPGVLPVGRMSQLAAFVLACFALWIVLSALRTRRDMPPIIWLCLVFFVAHCTYYFINARLELRYVLAAFTCLLIVFGILLGGRSRGLIGLPPTLVPVLPVAMIAVATIAGFDAWDKYQGTTRTHGGHGDLYDAARWLRENAPEATVGAWNAGILSYFSRVEVVNLDGVINDDALAANRTASIDAFIRARGIDYLADNSAQIVRHLKQTAEGTSLLGPEVARLGRAAVHEVAPPAVP